MGPGPSDVHPRVSAALARPTIGHMDPAFLGMMDELKAMLQMAFQTDNELTLPVSAPGSAGMECAFANLVEPGDTVLVARNGVFGARMLENVRRIGGEPVVVDAPWGQPVDADAVAAALEEHPATKVVAFVHAETSTGVRSDAARLCALAREHGALSIVDCVTSLGGVEVDVDGWQADAVYSGTQKCLSAPPGISPVTFSPRAARVIAARNRPVQSWFLDLNLVLAYWQGEQRVYHHTAPVNALYALHEALVMLEEEGLESAWGRHERHHRAFVAGIEAMGLDMLVDPAHRLPQLNTVRIPDGVDEARVRSRLLAGYGMEIGAGLGSLAGRVWRIGIMGQSATERNVLLCLAALEAELARQGAVSVPGRAVAAAQASYAATS